MRRSFDGLSGMVESCLGEDPIVGCPYLFSAIAAETVLRFYTGTGMVMRCGTSDLKRGTFTLGVEKGLSSCLSSAQLAMLLEGNNSSSLTESLWSKKNK